MSTVADYLGRRVDYVAFQGVFPGRKEQLLVQELVTSAGGGSVVAGIQKLAQRVLAALLTVPGSKRYRPRDGCQFMADAYAGRWRTVADVEQSFYLSRLDVRRQVVADEADDDPDDERYSSLTLLGVTLAGTVVTVRVQLTSRAGQAYVYLTPIKVSTR